MSFGNRSLAIARSRYTATLSSYQAQIERRADEYFSTASDRQFYRFTIPPVDIDPCYKTCLLYLRSFHFVDPMGSWSFDDGLPPAGLKKPITTPAVEVRVQHNLPRSSECSVVQQGPSNALAVVPLTEVTTIPVLNIPAAGAAAAAPLVSSKGYTFHGSAAQDGLLCSILPGQDITISITNSLHYTAGPDPNAPKYPGLLLPTNQQFIMRLEYQLVANEAENEMTMK